MSRTFEMKWSWKGTGWDGWDGWDYGRGGRDEMEMEFRSFFFSSRPAKKKKKQKSE